MLLQAINRAMQQSELLTYFKQAAHYSAVSTVAEPSLAPLLGQWAGAAAGTWPERACWPAPVRSGGRSGLLRSGL